MNAKDDSRTLDDLFGEAAGDRSEVDLGEGIKVGRLGRFGELVIEGRTLRELPASTVEEVARGLRKAADERFLDPARNPLIKTD